MPRHMLTAGILKNFTPLHTLTDEHRTRLAKRVLVEDIAKGASICAEGGTDNDTIYLLEGGVEMRSRSSSMSRVVQAGTPDAAFPVAPGRPRPYTVTATTAARIFRIDNAKLDRAVLLDEVSTTITRVHAAGSAFAGDSEWLEETLASPAFGALAREYVAMLLLKLEPLIVKTGEAVIRQGEAGDYYYIVKEGQLTVSRKDPLGKVKLVSTLKRGDVFGEEALLTGDPRNASIVAMRDSIVMRLAKSDFEELLKKPLITQVTVEEARDRMRRGAALVDVRSAAEFQQGALKGSVNIPIAELRARLTQLDPVYPYVLYCRNGVQSEVAAFLLRQRGFEVAVLRGGLESILK
jgi:CRP-like cAMP-binding protein